ncbi:hypothetical protein KVH02_07550 [Streptomyces olivaceus]|uniref:Aromatic ring-opening dioxygenase LigA n=1 Tax=Streptomyces olivaceus TaxID=47716 RepID=A0ABS7VZ82_STROV|nr:hypothetical protein [Streptomyces olivaceus]MBZ6088182.1 hypothetical protein [Streptomyces olivaceus]MBZ6094982.1 hypothetical protein [Streptomyces olivaceus]MBZ6116321.1 hypothetical protein [Streptomyces olivaceus]MBZ6151026.1 hypothetical protein [Streptomyces olivaceus]MBZ6297388.1 hypothetical protein [Streptomyces olivaceus]
MTTGSSSPRSPEYSISALDLPTGETTTTTGTARPPGTRPRTTAQPDGRDADVWGTGLDDDDLLDLHPDPDLREPEFSAPDPADRGLPGADRPGPGGTAAPRTEDRREAPEADPADRAYGDPVGDLVRAAVADRPLEEVVDLITTLEQSPKYAQATVDALRAVGVNRSVEDVTRLVGLLTRPPRHPDSADEAIRAAAESRSVEDVTRLMGLLHRTSLEPHCGQAAVQAAATGRPVGELVELIGRLGEDGHVREESPDARQLRAARDAAEAPGAEDAGESDQPPPRDGVFAAAARRGRERRGIRRTGRRGPDDDRAQDRAADGSPARDRDPNATERDGGMSRPARADGKKSPVRRSARGPAWPAWLTVAVLAGCGVAFFPLHRADASARAYGVALGLSALCLVLALLLTVRPAVPLLAGAVVAPAALAAAKLYGGATPTARVSPVTDLAMAPAWLAVAVAVAAALVALTALCVRVASQDTARRRPVRRRVAAAK